MSSVEQNFDPDDVERAKEQIRGLVREIAQLSKSEVAPLEFYNEMLTRVVTALAAAGGAIWTLNDGGRIELEYQINLRETRLAENQENLGRHTRLLQKVLTDGQGLLVPPHSGGGENGEAANPTDYLLVLGPLKTDKEINGIVEIFQRPNASVNIQRGYLRFLLQMCELAGDYLKTRQLRSFSDRQTLWSQLENFTRATHKSLDPRTASYTIANEGRRLIECDRVSVAILKGKKCRMEAISGQDVFDKRSNAVVLLERLASAVVATGETVWYTGDTSDMAPQVEEAVQAYVDESHSKTVGIIPLKRPQEPDSKELPQTVGALIVEQIEDSQAREGFLHRVDVVADHSSTALSNALEHQNLFLMPLWRAIGKATWVVKGRTLPKTILIASAVVALLTWFVVWPADFELQGKGSLQPVVQREVFAGVDGRVRKVLVKHGDHVQKGQEVAEMESNELEVQLADVRGKLLSTRQQAGATVYRLNKEKNLKPDERNRLQGELAGYEKLIESYQTQIELLDAKKRQLTVVSPIDGTVVTWDVQNELNNRPVQRGQILMRVADETQDWELQVHMGEDRMGHISAAQRELKPELDVSYILTTNPGTKLHGTVKEIHRTAEVHGDEGNTVLVKVKIDRHDLMSPPADPGAEGGPTAAPTMPNIGTGVTARLYCGRAPIGYVWFHDLIAFVQSKILFRL